MLGAAVLAAICSMVYGFLALISAAATVLAGIGILAHAESIHAGESALHGGRDVAAGIRSGPNVGERASTAVDHVELLDGVERLS
jgi:hypothetical protein